MELTASSTTHGPGSSPIGIAASAIVTAVVLGLTLSFGAAAQESAPAQAPAAAQESPAEAAHPAERDGRHRGAPHKAAQKKAAPPAAVASDASKPAEAAKPPAAPAPAPPMGTPVPAAPTAPTAPATTGELEPVIHARQAQLTTCMDNVVSQAGRVVDRPHKAMSTWVTKAPNDNVFQSLVGLTYPSPVAPHGLAVILAAPLGPNRCEGQSVQVFPTARPCTVVQAALVKTGRTLSDLDGLPVIETPGGFRNVLMPGAGGSCVVVTTRLQ